ncbi:hypothetical protein Patl1_30999 [Pistacia atlantica]|uniref:Uncharacterized protein n=1 Tax=Pistacia atlantica TaxID=434234 RepID=A0ACC1ABF6_9ROSI|nr:hypothetical protein Patl1_30999 [Pistacia atlantica]
MDVLRLATFTGAAPNVSDAYTINGQPGDLYRCSSQETVRFPVDSGETILLRIINSAMNQELFFGVANHKLTVVGVDSSYTKPFTTSVIMIGPGQTTNVLLKADQPPGRYYMAAHAYNSATNAAFDNTTTTAILEYKTASRSSKNGKSSTPIFPQLPGIWLMHCHIDSHLTWGLAMVFLVENGVGKLQSVQPPPLDLPRC